MGISTKYHDAKSAVTFVMVSVSLRGESSPIGRLAASSWRSEEVMVVALSIEEKREAIRNLCEAFHECYKCPLYEYYDGNRNHGCFEVTLADELIEKHYAIIFGESDPSTPVIKDSGDRTEFTSGAVRDMHTGKGRLDLLPCSAILELAKHFENCAI